MERKKWTPRQEITDDLLKFRERRKWQVALRRYVVDGNISGDYAVYFGLTIGQFRNWIEIQFSEGLRWENFGSAWQFDHIVPIGYFDFSDEEDLFICWNFINIGIEKTGVKASEPAGITLLAVRPYFESLYNKTGYSVCRQMLEKISRIEASGLVPRPEMEKFILTNKKQLETVISFSKTEFNSLNKGITSEDILLEREIIKKFG